MIPRGKGEIRLIMGIKFIFILMIIVLCLNSKSTAVFWCFILNNFITNEFLFLDSRNTSLLLSLNLYDDAKWTLNQNFILIWISVNGSKWYNQYRIVYPLIGFEPFSAHVLNILCSKLCCLVDTLSSKSIIGNMVLQRGLHGTERLLHNALGRRQERDLNL